MTQQTQTPQESVTGNSEGWGAKCGLVEKMDLRGKGILNVFAVSAEAAKKWVVSMRQTDNIWEGDD